MRENLSVDTSFDAFIYSANAIFSSLVTVLTLKWREIKEEQDNFSLLNQVRTVVFTLQDGLFDAYYFKCNDFLVEIYLSGVSLINLSGILIIHCVFATEYCARCSKHRAWLTSAVLDSILGEWARYGYSGNCLVKPCYVEKIVSKVIIVSKMPKRRRKNEENRLFSPKPGFRQSWTKVLGQYCNNHIFLSFLGSLLKQWIIFEIFLPFSLPPPYTKLKLGKNSGYTRPTLFVGWGEGWDLCELENARETQKCPKAFVHDCKYFYLTLTFNIMYTWIFENWVSKKSTHSTTWQCKTIKHHSKDDWKHLSDAGQ